MEGIKYKNLLEIGEVVIEIQGVENSDLAVPVNNTLVGCTSFLAACLNISTILLHLGDTYKLHQTLPIACTQFLFYYTKNIPPL